MKALIVLLCFILSLSACFAADKSNEQPPVINATTVTINPSVHSSNDSVSVEPPIPATTTTVTPTPSTPTPKPTTTTTTSTTTTTTTTTTTPKPTTPTTTLKPTTPAPTTASTTTTTPKPNVTTTTPPPPHKNERKFDGPSFVGGMILALGLVGIGFVAFKFYKARTELNYHTLRNPIEGNFQI